MREKHCEICKNSFSTMFRVQYKPNKNWVFVCEACLISVKENNPHYKYKLNKKFSFPQTQKPW